LVARKLKWNQNEDAFVINKPTILPGCEVVTLKVEFTKYQLKFDFELVIILNLSSNKRVIVVL
jgi:hypothetical protein